MFSTRYVLEHDQKNQKKHDLSTNVKLLEQFFVV